MGLTVRCKLSKLRHTRCAVKSCGKMQRPKWLAGTPTLTQSAILTSHSGCDHIMDPVTSILVKDMWQWWANRGQAPANAHAGTLPRLSPHAVTAAAAAAETQQLLLTCACSASSFDNDQHQAMTLR